MNTPTRIARYDIIRRLGKSMTEVYLAEDIDNGRKVALKLIRTGGDSVSRLVLEAERRGAAIQQQLQALDSRMIEIYEYGEYEGWFFVAMQYVEGRTVAEVLASERRIDPLRAASIALEVCEQLVKFHTRKPAVVHGDIKPSNIHLGHSDTVRLLDFGIAKMLRINRDDTSHYFGSPSYCSPERLIRSAVDPHSDLWALGATLYEMLAGVPPYQADNTRKLESLIRSRRAPRALSTNCPLPLRAIVGKALAADPRARYASAHDFQSDLQAFLERRPPVAERELSQRPRWSANSTIEAAREYLLLATRTVARVRVRGVSAAGALGWFALGMALWIGGALGWESTRPRPAPVAVNAPREDPDLYASAGRRILDSYRSSPDSRLDDFDWHKAEVYFTRATELGGNDDRTLGELALSRGYATLERLSDETYSADAASRLRDYVLSQFNDAAARLPHSPDPHLALARLYVYSFHDPDKAMAEFDRAERLGATLGQREFAQQADVFQFVNQPARSSSPAHRRSRTWR